MDSNNQQHQESILQLMQITECDNFEKAAHYLQMANNNLERAVELYFELENLQRNQSQTSTVNPPVQQQEVQSEERKQIQELNSAIFNSIFNQPQPSLIQQQSTPSSQITSEQKKLVEEYKKFINQKKVTDDTPLYKKAFNGIKSTLSFGKNLSFLFQNILFKVWKQKDETVDFISYLHKYKIKSRVQFNMGNLQKNLELSIKNFKPVLLYVHDPNADGYIETVFDSESLAQFINKNYQTFGYLKTSQELISQLKDISPLVQTPCFFVLKKDIFDKVLKMKEIVRILYQFMGQQISQDMNLEDLQKELKMQRGAFNKAYILEEQIKKEVEQENRQQQFNPFNSVYHPQLRQQNSSYMTDEQRLQQQLKLQQERELRQQQEEAFKLAEKQSKLQLLKKQEEEKLKREQEEAKQREQEERLMYKAQLMSNLTDEPSENNPHNAQWRKIGSEIFKHRQNLSKVYRNNLFGKILFDYVFCHNETTFENPDGPFDLIQTFPRLSLKDKKDQQILDIFQESQMEQLIVSEE